MDNKDKDNKDNDNNIKKECIRCTKCNKKLKLTQQFECSCNKIFCTEHRYKEEHNCSAFVLSIEREKLAKTMPRIETEKIIKI